jgi:hypothetical protein
MQPKYLAGMCILAIAAAPAPAAAADRVFWDAFEAPITAEPATWTWVPFDDAVCGTGSATGIGVNLTSASDRVLIFLAGGGACWDAFTCFTLHTAAHFDGYDAADFAIDAAGVLAQAGGFFDRETAANPFKDYSYVAVPYCTGDAHAGDNVVTFGENTAHFVGYRNVRAYLERLALTFPTADRIVLAGSSGGGIGAVANWRQVAEAFPNARVDMIDDSGALLPEDVFPSPNTRELTIRAAWNLAATLPPGCAGCAASLDVLYGFYANEYPNSRAALLSYQQDNVLPSFYDIDTAHFTTGLAETEAAWFDETTNFRFFNVSGTGHVLWTSPSTTTGTTSVQQFLQQMVDDDPGWTSVTPP